MDGSAHRFTTLPAAAAIGKINTDVLYTSVTCSTSQKHTRKMCHCTGSSEEFGSQPRFGFILF